MPNLTKDEVLRLLGASPEAIGKGLSEFTEAAKILSSDHPRLIDEYPLEWVGVFQGHVAATARDFDALLAQLTAKGVPIDQTIVRFIDKEEKTLLL